MKYVYTSSLADDLVCVFEMEGGTGRLKRRFEMKVEGGPGPLVIDRQRRMAYVGLRRSFELASFKMDPQTGSLTRASTIPVEAEPCYLALDQNRRYLLSAYYLPGVMGIHSLQESGDIGTTPVEWHRTGPGAHSIQTDPSNRFLFVGHVAGPDRADGIYQFQFSQESGRIAPNQKPIVRAEVGFGPRHVHFHPTGPFLYAANEQASSVSLFRLDQLTGMLTHVATTSSLRDKARKDDACSGIVLTPAGSILYVANRGRGTISCFSVDLGSGKLLLRGEAPTEPAPQALYCDPGGAFLFSTSIATEFLTSHQIKPGSGSLTPFERHAVGKFALRVAVADLGV